MKYDFEHYLEAGHGRAYMIAKADPERYREKIMDACRKDYAYDMQSEGSRAFLTYDLISLFDDPTPFIEAIKESYEDPVADKDWKQICYLTDLLLFFEQRKTVIQKYKQLEKHLYSDEPLSDMVPLCQPFEYVAIKLIEDSSIKVIWNVANDIGKWFLSRTEDPQSLASRFLWFDGNLEDELGEDRFDELLKYNSDSDGIKEYIRIMSLPCEFGRKYGVEKATSDNQRLAEEVNAALSLLKDERLHDYAVSVLKKGFDSAAVSILLNNIRKSDESFILSILEELPVTEDNEGDWHGIASDIGSNGDNPEMPESLLTWAYESTLCSFCRKNIVEKMINRGMLTDELKEELRWDANLDISKMVDDDREEE